MRIIAITAGVALAAAWAGASWVYEGQWGDYGRGPGGFDSPRGLAVAANGNVSVADSDNDRIQYFRWSDPAVVPTSLGKVKAIFR